MTIVFVLEAAGAGCASSSAKADAGAAGKDGGADAHGPDGAGGSGGVLGSGGVGGVLTGSGGAAGASGSGGGGETGAVGGVMGSAGSGITGIGGTGARSDRGDAGPYYALDMNDVTVLVPLPRSVVTPVILKGSDLADDGTALLPRALFDRLVQDGDRGHPILASGAYERVHLVAVRFDLCDRHLPGLCPEMEDARMRLVFQPVADTSGADDTGFHAFYSIRNDEIAGAVAALRDLARSVPAQSGFLRISPALSAADPEGYATKLRAFVKRYGGDSRVLRLTMNARSPTSEQFQWILRGVEKKAAESGFVDITIVGASEILESVVFAGNTGFDVKPITDTPPGLSGAIVQRTFDQGDPTKKRAYMAALAAVENPMSQTAETVACVGCHVSTIVMDARALFTAIDPLTLPGRYMSKFDLSVVGGKLAQTPGTIRALGYLGKEAMISQRVVNDTAQTLTEIDSRYPAP